MRTGIAALAVLLFVTISGARMTEGRGQSPSPAPTAQAPAAAQAPAPAQKAGTTPERGLVDQYCVGCHSERGKAGGLSLAGVDLSDAHNAEVAEKVVRKLRGGLMPP